LSGRVGLLWGQFLLAFLLNWIYVGIYYQMDDEAIWTLGVQSLMRGQLPYRDFSTHITPGTYFLSWPYFSLFGFSPLAVRGLAALIAAATGFWVQLVAWRCLRGPWQYLPWLMWATSGIYPHAILNYHWMSSLTVTAGTYWALRWVQDTPTPDQASRGPSKSSARANSFALALGICGGLGFWITQSGGMILALAALMVWLRFRPAGLIWVGLGAALTSVLVWLPLWRLAPAIWQQNVVEAAQLLARRQTPFDLGAGPRILVNIVKAPWGSQTLASLALVTDGWLTWERYSLFYPVVGLSLFWVERNKDRNTAVVGWCLVAWILTIVRRQTLPYLSYTGPLYGLMLVSLLARWAGSRVCAGLVGVCLINYGIRWLDMQHRYVLPIQTRSGLYWGADPVEAAIMQRTHDWVERYLPVGSRVFAYPYFTSLYTTEGLVNATREPLLMEGVYPRSRLLGCKQSLSQQKIEYVVVYPLVASAVADVCPISVPDYERARDEWLRELVEDYEMVDKYGMLKLYRRRP